MNFLESIVYQTEQFPGSPEFRALRMVVLSDGQFWGFAYENGGPLRVYRLTSAEDFKIPGRVAEDTIPWAPDRAMGMTTFRYQAGRWLQERKNSPARQRAEARNKITKSAG